MEYELGNYSNRGWSSIDNNIHIKEEERINMICPKCKREMMRITLKTRLNGSNTYNVCQTCEIKVKE
jgi:predicted RNA-binding Zn-ribbon protein involved in translation (DUF1610 family)